ncbi:Nicotinate degradation protein R [Thalassovita gelatinovora]|uniref:Nicotinate degradation protein R n=1 Tax=Thalassovita gelatinovora TaxID=53501 RepID=A0A0P1G0H0_THAGE|nr:MarR family transcriptional regulator [Thalassovita gelatinovora]QIZ79754.1 MarR family transcriptional regulator [Thalassovita gelatinovora]CUH66767.1 Nicotinate degradation protein R [Thalassovita gelatinovora]SEQ42405.1 transcriptional regulator, MarR family [Thalassovita gelatinovora]
MTDDGTLKPSTAYVLDEQVGYLLRLANQRHATIFQTHAVDGLTPTQFTALVRLAEHGKCSQNQLGRYAAMDIATIKGVVDRLRGKGLVQTEASQQDRRRSLVSLTPAGQDLVQDLYHAGEAITDETLAPLSPAEQRNFIKLLRKLG